MVAVIADIAEIKRIMTIVEKLQNQYTGPYGSTTLLHDFLTWGGKGEDMGLDMDEGTENPPH
jgi:hypothetical protein